MSVATNNCRKQVSLIQVQVDSPPGYPSTDNVKIKQVGHRSPLEPPHLFSHPHEARSAVQWQRSVSVPSQACSRQSSFSFSLYVYLIILALYVGKVIFHSIPCVFKRSCMFKLVSVLFIVFHWAQVLSFPTSFFFNILSVTYILHFHTNHIISLLILQKKFLKTGF